MVVSSNVNRRIVLASRPNGAPVKENWKLEEVPKPQPKQGEVLLRTIYISLDPYLRGRMTEGPSYVECINIGEVFGGKIAESVYVVEQSNNPNFKVGELVEGSFGWQDYAISDGKDLIKLDGPELNDPVKAIGALGMPGFTAYYGFNEIGQPKKGETVVVAAATGAVGSLVGQFAKAKGCYVVGIAGGDEKCKYAVEKLGFDKCLDHKKGDLKQLLKDACPKGIDIYYENVGGKVFEAVFPLLNVMSRVPLCGLISLYNATSLQNGEINLPGFQITLLKKRIRYEGFIIFDHWSGYDKFKKETRDLVKKGSFVFKEDIVKGLENAPSALMGLLEGKNFGKLVIQVGDI
ncbi:hypothetical protein CYY_005157 [Polysphondylium violaceum]|uniref:Enoyl reductase (ER) domain-containing protein n=1 Tax=Polysphondylium violaceum TaxID=133409 RepID=A0A8J4PTE9_9MYCE|nr:hypothetical protein CYY_005157 [Polysphondylium violaceum]